MTCKDCPNRVVGCHATCPDYLAFVEERKELYKRRQQHMIGENLDVERSIKKRMNVITIKRRRKGY